MLRMVYVSQMDIFMYLMEERKEMIETLLQMCNDLLEEHRELQIKYLELKYGKKTSKKIR